MQCPLVAEGPPITTAGLFLYRREKQKALDLREKFDVRLDSVNRLLIRISDAEPDLRAEIASLEHRIVTHSPRVGKAMLDGRDWESPVRIHLGQGSAKDIDIRRDQCRRIFRVLAQKHHPDKGGTVEHFQRLRKAVLSLDLEFLRVQEVLDFKEKSIFWQCGEGSDFWDLQSQKIRVNFQILEANRMYPVARAYMSGRKTEASTLMRRWMEDQVAILRHELTSIMNRRLTQELDAGITPD